MENQRASWGDSRTSGAAVQRSDLRRLLILVSNGTEASSLARFVPRAETGLTIVVSSNRNAGREEARGFDLIAIDISAGAGRALGWGLELLERDGTANIVFFCEDASSPELAAVRALGRTTIANGPGAGEWLVAAAPALIRVERARRELGRAEAMVPPFQANPSDEPRGVPLPMAVAEQRFRETYLRGAIAGAGNRARAAQQAGIPYRTFCKAIQSLEIPAPARGRHG